MHSTVTRVSLAFIGILSVTVLVMGGVIYVAMDELIERQTDSLIETDVEGLADLYRREGMSGLLATIADRIRREPNRSSIYLVTDAARRPIAGNISFWPRVPAGPDGYLEFGVAAEGNVAVSRARAKPFLMKGGINLLVGRDMTAFAGTKAQLRMAIGWGVVAALCLGFGVAFVFSRRTRQRLEAISHTSSQVMRGNLDDRVPLSGSDDDLNELALSLNAMLDEIQKLISGIEHITNNIAHDLRTPLARVRNRLVEIQRREPGQEQAAACIEELDRLLVTFNALLRISKLEASRPRQQFGAEDLATIAANAVDLYAPVAEEKRIELSLNTSKHIIAAVDRELVMQCLCNLIDNAIKYSNPGATVEVSVAYGPAGPSIAVMDNGPGIATNERERVFDRFYRGVGTASGEGTGLGLSLVQAICTYHDAELDLLDNCPGLGVRIQFAEHRRMTYVAA